MAIYCLLFLNSFNFTKHEYIIGCNTEIPQAAMMRFLTFVLEISYH